MKTKLKVIMLLLCLLVIGSSIAQDKNTIDKFKVYGTLKGLNVPYIFIDYTHEVTGDRVWDTVYVENEHFSYTTKLKNTKRIAIWPLIARKTKETMGKSKRIEFLVRPGDVIEFKGDVTETFNAVPTGTSLNDAMNSFNKKSEALYIKSNEMMTQYYDLKEDDSSRKNIYDSILRIGEKIIKMKKSFIQNNPESEVSAFYLSEMAKRKELDDNEALELLNGFDYSLKTSPFYIDIVTRLKGSEATKVGKMVPEVITSRTLDGEQFDLKSLRGKYVLIDFWGTWCGPCIDEMPTVKVYNEKYKNQLVVVGINSGDTKQDIIDFVTYKGYNWLHLMSKKGVNKDNFVSKFNISGFPTKFIIDPNGVIVEKYVGRSEDAFIRLDKLLKE